MSTGACWPLARASRVADRLVEILTPHCLRVQVAGSIRRGCPDVGDIEIVLLPRVVERMAPGPGLLFDVPRRVVVSLAWEALDALTTEGKLPAPSKGGQRYRCYPATEKTLQVDVFQVTDGRAWGPLLAVRTGPAGYSKFLAGVKLRQRGLYLEGGLVHRNGVVVPCPEEADFFDACGMPWVEPRDRR